MQDDFQGPRYLYALWVPLRGVEEVENVWNTFSRYDLRDGGGRTESGTEVESNAGS